MERLQSRPVSIVGTGKAGAGSAEPCPGGRTERQDHPLVAICMAAYRPDPVLCRIQLRSIAEQTYPNWCLVISDETPPGAPGIEELLDEEIRTRCLVRRYENRLGFALNFERALSLCPASAAYIAFADQDDRWYPHKIARSVQAMGSHGAIYSDFTAVTEDGAIISTTQWKNRVAAHGTLLDLLFFNAVSGASLMVRRSVADYAMPFPRFNGMLHDHWLALIALATEGLYHHPEALYDYVQHGSNAIGFNYVNDQRKFVRKIASHAESLIFSGRKRKEGGRRALEYNEYAMYIEHMQSALQHRLAYLGEREFIASNDAQQTLKVFGGLQEERLLGFARGESILGLKVSDRVAAAHVLAYAQYRTRRAAAVQKLLKDCAV